MFSLASALTPSCFCGHTHTTHGNRDKRIQAQALLLIALVSHVNSQYAGTLYPQPEVDLGEGFEPLFVSQPGQPNIIWGNSASGLMHQSLGFDGSPLLTDPQSVASSPYHSKKALVYPNGQIGMALEVVVDKMRHLDFCLWNPDWSLSKCQRLHTATGEELPLRPDVTYGNEMTVVAAMHMDPIDRGGPLSNNYYSELYFLDNMFQEVGSPLRLRTEGNNTLIRNPSVDWDSETQKFTCAFSLNEGNPIHTRSALWRPAMQTFSSIYTARENTQFFYPSLAGRPKTVTPPNTLLFNLGILGYGASFHDPYRTVGLDTGPGHLGYFYDAQGNAVGLSEINVVTILGAREGIKDFDIQNGPFVALNDSHFFGAWPVEQQLVPVPYLLRGQFFTFTGDRIESASDFITIFESPSDAWSSPSLFAIPGEQGVIIAAEKAGRIWVKALHFQELIRVPTTTSQAETTSLHTTLSSKPTSTTAARTQLSPAASTVRSSPQSTIPSSNSRLSTTLRSLSSTRQSTNASSTPSGSMTETAVTASRTLANSLSSQNTPLSGPFTVHLPDEESEFPLWAIGAIVGGILLSLAASLACLWTRRKDPKPLSQSRGDVSLDPYKQHQKPNATRSSTYGPAPGQSQHPHPYTAGPLALNSSNPPRAHDTYAKAPPPNVGTVFVGDFPSEDSRQPDVLYDTMPNSTNYDSTDQPLV